MFQRLLFAIALGSVIPTTTISAADGGPAQNPIFPGRLRCEYRSNPLGIDVPHPRLEWIVETSSPASRRLGQTAYQILVASSVERLAVDNGDLWNSEKVASPETASIPYGGKPLLSFQRVWWKIRLWGQNGYASSWSEPAQWTTGILRPADWENAVWIAAPAKLSADPTGTTILRREFPAKPGLKRALLAVCGLGQYELSINGRAVTADRLTPGWTEYDKTCLYDTYDVTEHVQDGRNALGILLGNGMYRVTKGTRYAKFQHSFGPLQAIAYLRIEYNDGTTESVVTDETWRAGESPMTFSSVYGGEDWDARKLQNGWDQPGFNAASWQPVVLTKGPGGNLKGTPRAAPAIQLFGADSPVSRHALASGVTIYDLGRTASHLTRFTAQGAAGSSIRITPSELLNDDGTLFTNNYNGKAWSDYTLAGTGPETYTAKFYYGGNRYVKVECLPSRDSPELPRILNIDGMVIHSSIASAGQFSCSNELFNQIYRMICSAELSNMMSVISDCPHRERLGWLEQDHLHGPSFHYNYDMRPFMQKILGDMADCQLPDGLIPTHVPEYPKFPPNWRDAIEWGSAGVMVPWQAYQFTGDTAFLDKNYELMRRYVVYLASKAKAGIAAPGLGDWIGTKASPDTPRELIATALYFEDARVLGRSASLLHREADAAAYRNLSSSIRETFNKTFFNSQTNQYGTGSQCANALALSLDLVAPERRKAVLDNLIADLQQRNYAMTVGELGLAYLLRALAQAGRSDVIFAINNQTENPGYGYQLKKGATALCETWDAGRDNSQVQFMLGHIVEWFYHDLAGIQLDPENPGFCHFTIAPSTPGNLTEVKASYDSVRGKIVSEWSRSAGTITLHVVVPPNTTATIVLPVPASSPVTEGGRAIADAEGVTKALLVGDQATFNVGSGDYTFVAATKRQDP